VFVEHVKTETDIRSELACSESKSRLLHWQEVSLELHRREVVSIWRVSVQRTIGYGYQALGQG